MSPTTVTEIIQEPLILVITFDLNFAKFQEWKVIMSFEDKKMVDYKIQEYVELKGTLLVGFPMQHQEKRLERYDLSMIPEW